MKKLIIVIVCLFSFVNILNAECTYKELKNLNILSNYVDVNYLYNDNGTFTLNIVNVPNELNILINNIQYQSMNNEVNIPGFSSGLIVPIDIISSSISSCPDEKLRIINYSIPYINSYYNHEKCIGHENLEVCSRKFLNYELSENTFNKLIDKALKNDINQNKEDDKIFEQKEEDWDRAIKYIKKMVIPLILIISSGTITLLICGMIFRKIKHGL